VIVGQSVALCINTNLSQLMLFHCIDPVSISRFSSVIALNTSFENRYKATAVPVRLLDPALCDFSKLQLFLFFFFFVGLRELKPSISCPDWFNMSVRLITASIQYITSHLMFTIYNSNDDFCCTGYSCYLWCKECFSELPSYFSFRIAISYSVL
jgi:hypothetical protein